MRAFSFSALAISVAVLSGCSSRPGGDVGEMLSAPASLIDLASLLRAGGTGGRPPTQLSDLERHKSLFPLGYKAVKNGDVIVLWGTPPKGEGAIEKGESQDLIAYEKNVPQDGGFVLLSGGTIKRMTAAEFAAAPKAGKPSH